MFFMGGFYWYNQIKLCLQDEKHTSFRTPQGIYCNTVILFGLKNARATYQRAMKIIFRNHLQNIVKCYVDIVVKSQSKKDHLNDLRTIFKLKMNPTKSFLGVSCEKFLSFVVMATSIHLDPCSLQETLKNSWIYKDDQHTSVTSLPIKPKNTNPFLG